MAKSGARDIGWVTKKLKLYYAGHLERDKKIGIEL